MEPRIANVDMAAAWDGEEGAGWARDHERYNLSAARFQALLKDVAAVQPGHAVLDVGCGTGAATLAAARAAGPSGRAHGIDLSTAQLAVARELAAAEGLATVTFEHADAEVHPFPASAFDVVLSRFGVMFFGQPVEAFANLLRATRPGGRMAFVAWRDVAENEWFRCVRAALAVGRDLPRPEAGLPGPMGLSDPELTAGVLAGAGWEAVHLEAVDLPYWAGHDAEDAASFVRRSGLFRGLTAGLDVAQLAEAGAALLATMAEHETAEGVVFGSGVWAVTASRPVA